MDKPFQVTPDTWVLPAHFPVPGAGVLAINAFVIKAQQPILVDTGTGNDSEQFMKALESVIDPRELRWIWLTHDDADHTGSLQRIFEAAPKARLAANSLAVLRMSTAWPVPMDRVYWLNPGDSIGAGDRTLTAVRPPLFDNPTTIGLYDDTSEVFFAADCFGALIPEPVRNVDELSEADLTQGMTGWASTDNPWAHLVDPGKFGQSLETIRRMAPKTILSGHLPPAQERTDQFLELLAAVPASPPAVAPGQKALDQILGRIS